MKNFMDKDFLLDTPTAQTLYHECAETLPIIDYHCHVDPREIYEDRRFTNIYQTWLESDHYKWRLMRSNGVEEHYITGNASEREKFQKFAEALPRAIGNPMYHWCHLELKTYFGYEGVLNGETAQEIWDLSVKKLADPDMTVRGIIKKSNVAFIGTTDDPTSTLEWHKKLAADPTFQTACKPSFRPDKALNIEKPGWRSFLHELSAVSGIEIVDYASLKQALTQRMSYFSEVGCRAADHGLDYVPYVPAAENELETIMQKGLRGEVVAAIEVDAFKTALVLFCAAQYASLGWVMQIHYNCMRNPNSAMLAKIGPDTGFDSINTTSRADALYRLLDTLYAANTLPRTVLYSLDPNENELLDTMLGAFQGTEVPGKIQHGSAWWFNDTKTGMSAQLTSLANLSLLGNFIGMLTDSRSFLSYTRHAYFRRILCRLIGAWVENGEYPADMKMLGCLVGDICYHNAKRYFGL